MNLNLSSMSSHLSCEWHGVQPRFLGWKLCKLNTCKIWMSDCWRELCKHVGKVAKDVVFFNEAKASKTLLPGQKRLLKVLSPQIWFLFLSKNQIHPFSCTSESPIWTAIFEIIHQSINPIDPPPSRRWPTSADIPKVMTICLATWQKKLV